MNEAYPRMSLRASGSALLLALCVGMASAVAGPQAVVVEAEKSADQRSAPALPTARDKAMAVADSPVRSLANAKPMSFEVNYVYRPGGQGELKSLTEASVLHSGDHYKIQFTPEDNGFVYIFQIDSKDAIFQLFPMDQFGGIRLAHENPVVAGKTYTLPGDDLSFQLDHNKGRETIFFLAFRERNFELEQQYQSLVKALRNRSEQMELIAANFVNNIRVRGLAAIVDDPEQETTQIRWNASESFEVPARRIENLCADCVTSITFTHR